MLSTDDKGFFSCFGLLIAGILAVVLGAIVGGWVLSILWGWFIVPLFGLPALSIPYAIGVSMLVRTFIPTSSNDKHEDSEWYELLIKAVLEPFVILGMGWVVLQFV